MFLKFINIVTGLFGYRWVYDESPIECSDDNLIEDEGWDDLDHQKARYRLEKITGD